MCDNTLANYNSMQVCIVIVCLCLLLQYSDFVSYFTTYLNVVYKR